MSKLSVSHFNTFPYGGAATSALRTHAQLCDQDVDSRFYFFRDDRGMNLAPGVHQVTLTPPPTSFFQQLLGKRKRRQAQKQIHRLYAEHLSKRDESLETFSMARLPQPGCLPMESIDVDAVHLHWVAFFADYPSFFSSIPRHIPIVWTLHDMNPFTGGCHYSGGCDRFVRGCGNCPQIISPDSNDVSTDSFHAKQVSLAGRKISVTAPSQWMLDQAMKSSIWPEQTSFTKIHLGFDRTHFFPMKRSAARAALNIESDAVLVAFGADDLNSKRKGLHHLISALAQLKTDRKVECLMFGGGQIEFDSALPRIHQLGFLNSIEQQRCAYNAADLVVVPSREDNQPQVGLEAMACGIPVVAFNTGGIPEYVRDGQTGCLVELGNESRLAQKISGLCDLESFRHRLGRAALKMVETEFDLTIQTQRYRTLYESLSQRQKNTDQSSALNRAA